MSALAESIEGFLDRTNGRGTAAQMRATLLDDAGSDGRVFRPEIDAAVRAYELGVAGAQGADWSALVATLTAEHGRTAAAAALDEWAMVIGTEWRPPLGADASATRPDERYARWIFVVALASLFGLAGVLIFMRGVSDPTEVATTNRPTTSSTTATTKTPTTSPPSSPTTSPPSSPTTSVDPGDAARAVEPVEVGADSTRYVGQLALTLCEGFDTPCQDPQPRNYVIFRDESGYRIANEYGVDLPLVREDPFTFSAVGQLTLEWGFTCGQKIDTSISLVLTMQALDTNIAGSAYVSNFHVVEDTFPTSSTECSPLRRVVEGNLSYSG